jgi:hypothetical protein
MVGLVRAGFFNSRAYPRQRLRMTEQCYDEIKGPAETEVMAQTLARDERFITPEL